MSTNFTPGVPHGRPAPAVRARLLALRQAYLVHTLKRTITDVMATEERDYRAFGLDKREMLAGLAHLLDTVRASVMANDSTLRAQTGGETRASVTLVRRRADPGPGSAPAFMARRVLLRPAAQT